MGPERVPVLVAQNSQGIDWVEYSEKFCLCSGAELLTRLNEALMPKKKPKSKTQRVKLFPDKSSQNNAQYY